MAKFTLLQMTQDILSNLNSDEVNSISDTTEALQVATILKQKYYDILTRAGLPDNKNLIQLDSSMDATKPVLMTVPSTVNRIEWVKYFDSNINDSASTTSTHAVNLDITDTSWTTTSLTSNTIGTGTKVFTVASSTLAISSGQGVVATAGANQMFGNVVSYVGTTLTITVTATIGSGTFSAWVLQSSAQGNSAPGYIYVTIYPIDQFIEHTNRFNPVDTNVRSFSFTELGNNFTFYYKIDQQPKFCTFISNRYVIFDGFDSTQDSTLQSSKSMCLAYLTPAFSMTDSFIPQMDDNQFPLLVSEAKALAFYELKQMPHAKAEQEIKRQWSSVSKNKQVDKPRYFDELANFGRVPRTGGYAGSGYGAYKWMRQAGP